MPLDPRAQAFLNQLSAAGGWPDPRTISIEERRRNLELFIQSQRRETEPVAVIEDRLIPGPSGQVPIRIYTPQGSRPFPVLVYFHGGAFAAGSIATEDSICRSLTNSALCMVVSVEYRLAPEHKFPAAPEDCYATTRWVAENATTVGVDPIRIAVGGTSAGGNLAAVVALMARDRGGPSLVYQLLMYACLDSACDTTSMRENEEGYMLTRDAIVLAWELYLPSNTDGDNPYASPLRVTGLHGLPPALVVTAEYDPLRDEGEAYAARLREAGVPVKCTRYEGMLHGGLPPEMGNEAWQEAAAALRTAFSIMGGENE